MSREATASRRLRLLAKWPLGIGLTSWRYMWRVTALHRDEQVGDPERHRAPELPEWLDRSDLQDTADGVGPLFHRRYSTLIRESPLSAEELMERVCADLNRVAPSEFVSFDKVRGSEGRMERNDEYVVRMPAPWDGPVRVIEVTPRSFSFVTLAGHLEAGQIRFAAEPEDRMLRFTIESWARNGDKLAELLYARLRMAKEVQLHMWTSLLERVTDMAGGRMTGGVQISTHRVNVS